MKKNVLVALVALGAVALSGCDETKTTEWYKEHPDEMNRVYATCKKTGDDTQNCRNAIEAHYRAQQHNAPVLDLDKAPDVDLFNKKKE